MTVIACDENFVSVDRQVTDANDIGYESKKFSKFKDKNGQRMIVMTTGSSAYGTRFIKFLQGYVEDLPEPPTEDDDGEAVVCYCDSNWHIWRIELYEVFAKDVGEDITDKMLPIAFGSGASYATGCMDSGKSSREAVRMASQRLTTCGKGRDSFKINKELWKAYQQKISK